MNKYSTAERTHWKIAAGMKEKEQKKIMLFVNAQKTGAFETKEKPVYVIYKWYCPKRTKDKSNISSQGRKFIEDALQSAGVIQGDGWNHIIGFTDLFFIDKAEPRIEVTITDDDLHIETDVHGKLNITKISVKGEAEICLTR